MPPPVLRYKGKIIWYPGIVFGRPPPVVDWNSGQGLGISSRGSSDALSDADGGLIWTTTEKLLVDLEETEHLNGVLSVIELCLTVLTEPTELLLLSLRALTRLCWGFQDRVVHIVNNGACAHIAKILHWHWKTEVGELILSILHVVIMVGDHGGREARIILGSLGVSAYLTAAMQWNRLHTKNCGDILEFGCKALYQIAIGSSENRLLLRRAGADKELFCLARYPFFLPQLQQQQVRDEAQKVLAVLKDQLLSDLTVLDDCWFIVGAVQMSVADVCYYSPLCPNEEKGEDLIQAALHALLRLLSPTDRQALAHPGALSWSRTTQFSLLGTCEMLVEVLKSLGFMIFIY